MRQLHRAAALAAGMLIAAAGMAHGGQVRVTVSNFAFSPASTALNVGDQVVWIWTGGSHSTTSGTDGTPIGDGAFNSDVLFAAPGGTGFTWKSTSVKLQPYYCEVHFATNMKGSLDIHASGVSVADLRISEVQYNLAGGLDLIEVSNFGTSIGDLGRFRLSLATGVSVQVPFNSVPIPAGGRLVIHANASGSNSSSDLFLPALPELPGSGALALYAPNTTDGTTLDDASQLVDFVQWGAGGGPNEGTAATAGFWTAGDFVPAVASGHSLELCAGTGQYGRSLWHDNAVPNFGTASNCTTPAVGTTWGRIKTLYR